MDWLFRSRDLDIRPPGMGKSLMVVPALEEIKLDIKNKSFHWIGNRVLSCFIPVDGHPRDPFIFIECNSASDSGSCFHPSKILPGKEGSRGNSRSTY